MSSPTDKKITPEQYLDLESQAERKSEYLAGEVYALPEASPSHHRIVNNLAAELRSHLRDGRCQAIGNHMRIRVEPADLYAYPDIVATCEEPRFEDAAFETLLNPTLIIEVVSPETVERDREEKFKRYRQLDSLQEYLLISSDRIRAELFSARDGEWISSVAEGLESTIALGGGSCVLPLSAIYDQVDFSPIDQRG